MSEAYATARVVAGTARAFALVIADGPFEGGQYDPDGQDGLRLDDVVRVVFCPDHPTLRARVVEEPHADDAYSVEAWSEVTMDVVRKPITWRQFVEFFPNILNPIRALLVNEQVDLGKVRVRRLTDRKHE